MNLFEKSYFIGEHTFTVGDVYNHLCFLTQEGVEPHPLALFAGWFFPKMQDAKVNPQDTPVEQALTFLANEYKQAFNDLIGAGIVTIELDERQETVINLTQKGLKYVKHRAPKIDFDQQAKNIRLMGESAAALEKRK